MEKVISDPNQLDILFTYQDAVEILLDIDHDEVTFSENVVSAPSFMKTAAKRGITLSETQTPISNRLAKGKHLSLERVKNIKRMAESAHEYIDSIDPESSTATKLLMWGIPAKKAQIKRVIKWADTVIQGAAS